jgi:hypothetical protein
MGTESTRCRNHLRGFNGGQRSPWGCFCVVRSAGFAEFDNYVAKNTHILLASAVWGVSIIRPQTACPVWPSFTFLVFRYDMTAPIAQTKATLFIDSLNEMLKSGVDDARLQEIEDEAIKMKSYGLLTDAYNVLGMVSALRMDVQEVDKYFNAAMKHTGREIDTLVNYAVALNNAYQSCRAIEIIGEALEGAPGDAGVIKRAIGLHVIAFDVEGIRKLTDELSRLGESLDEDIPFDELVEYEAAFIAADTTWQEVADRIGIAASAVSEVVNWPSTDIDIHDGVVLFRFVLDATVEEAYKAESAMIDAIAAQPFTAADRVIYFSCGVAA